MKTSKLIIAAFVLPLSVWLTACDKDDDPVGPPDETGNTVVTANISANTTWTKDKVYELAGRITVLSGATLTIQPGTIIKGQAGAGASSTALLIARGAKLMAEGTASAPIIFTSVADEITPADVAAGNFASPNLASTTNGLWGGLIVLGNAPISASAQAVQIEGIPTSDQNGLYGGTNAADNSGVLKYISIRHGGTEIGAGNEINGLTLGGVGSGTVIENIEVVGNQDDGIEWFGGTVNVKNVVIWDAGDDGLDTDQAWTGTVDNFAVLTVGGHCFELDGPEGAVNTNPHTIKNGYVDAEGSADLINTDANTYVNLQNIFITNIGAGQVVRHNAPAGVVTYSGINLDIPSGVITDYIKNNAGALVSVTGIVKGTANTFNAASLNWTWAAKAGALN